jgi:glycine betaine/proline transport system substrate-binding protein
MIFTSRDLENKAISTVLEQKIDAKTAAIQQLKANPKLVEAWLAGVNTYSGEDGLAALKKVLASK